MSVTEKNPKAHSAFRLTKLVYKHVTRAQLAKKTSGTSRNTRKGNNVLDAVLINTMCYQTNNSRGLYYKSKRQEFDFKSMLNLFLNLCVVIKT